MKMNKNNNFNIQLRNASAAMLVITAIGLLVSGFIVNPQGKIDQSVLVGFGESMAFASAAMGLHVRDRKLPDNKGTEQ